MIGLLLVIVLIVASALVAPAISVCKHHSLREWWSS